MIDGVKPFEAWTHPLRRVRRGLVAGLAVASLGVTPALARDAAPVGVVAAVGEPSAQLTAQSAAQSDPLGDSRMDPLRDEILAHLTAAWAIPALELDERVSRLRQAAAGLGLANLEAPAHALLLDENAGPRLDRARGASTLAPELPAARAALASALWSEGEPGRAWSELGAATRGVAHHVEAESWLQASLWDLLWRAAWAAGAGFLLLVGAFTFHELTRRSRALAPMLPAPARAAALGVLLLLPAALGEGILGVLLAALTLGVAAGGFARRAALVAAALLVLAALHPLLERAAAERVAFANAGAYAAAQQVERAVGSPVERARVWRNADRDPLAARALALEERRRGLTEASAARFATLVDREAPPSLLNNAAATRLQAGDRRGARLLLERANEAGDDAILLFNLAQVYGSLVRIEDQNTALTEAQHIHADRVHALTAAFGPGQIAERPMRGPGSAAAAAPPTLAPASLAASMRHRLAPGRLGARTLDTGFAILAATALGLLLGSGLTRAGRGEEDLRTRIAKLVENRGGDSSDRIQRLGILRAREAALARVERVLQLFVPGLAGLLAGRPWLAWLAVTWAAAGICLWTRSGGVVTPPLALGVWPELVAPWFLALAVLGHVALTAGSVLLKERG